MYLRVLADNFKADPNNQCRDMSNDHSELLFFKKSRSKKKQKPNSDHTVLSCVLSCQQNLYLLRCEQAAKTNLNETGIHKN